MKAPYLINAQSHLEITGIKLRLCLEVAAQNPTNIFQIQAILNDVGRQLGGWKKSL
jgi:hypothetical protein